MTGSPENFFCDWESHRHSEREAGQFWLGYLVFSADVRLQSTSISLALDYKSVIIKMYCSANILLEINRHMHITLYDHRTVKNCICLLCPHTPQSLLSVIPDSHWMTFLSPTPQVDCDQLHRRPMPGLTLLTLWLTPSHNGTKWPNSILKC